MHLQNSENRDKKKWKMVMGFARSHFSIDKDKGNVMIKTGDTFIQLRKGGDDGKVCKSG